MARLYNFITTVLACLLPLFWTAWKTFSWQEAAYPIEWIDDLIERSGKDISQTVTIITGATSGIGKSLATELYRRGGTVILAARNCEKCNEIANEIRSTCPDSTGQLNCHRLDLVDLDTINPFCEWFHSRYSSLTFLVNNAGVRYADKLVNLTDSIANAQGYDEVFTTNFLGHYLLTSLLLPMIEQGRVISTSSTYHFQADGSTLRISELKSMPEAANPSFKGFFHRRAAYAVSKLAQILHMKELQRRLDREGKGHKIQAIAFCPGWVRTNILPRGLAGLFVRTFAFSDKAALLSAMGALFDPDLKGGEVLTNQIPPLVTRSWFPAVLQVINKLHIRESSIDFLAIVMVLSQNFSYGYHNLSSSPESRDEKLSKDLMEWCEDELTRKGYIQLEGNGGRGY
eukprot:gene1826-1995_t